jgi:pyridoxal phosphate enzyme (YggS family)
MVNKNAYEGIIQKLEPNNCILVAVSKMKPPEAIKELYDLGQRDFGENYVQELVEKQATLPEDIRWHFIGHLQTNKVKFIAPFVSLIHGVDSLKLLKEINKQGSKSNKRIDVLLQVHIAREETKFGFDEEELEALFNSPDLEGLQHINVSGLMGMASLSDDTEVVRKEFKKLKKLFDQFASITTSNCNFKFISMGMSSDYQTALEEGSNMVRIGSLLFGRREMKL